jgi:hypothetical protein
MVPPRPAPDPADNHPARLVRAAGHLLELALFGPVYPFLALHLLLVLLAGRLIAHPEPPAGSRP